MYQPMEEPKAWLLRQSVQNGQNMVNQDKFTHSFSLSYNLEANQENLTNVLFQVTHFWLSLIRTSSQSMHANFSFCELQSFSSTCLSWSSMKFMWYNGWFLNSMKFKWYNGWFLPYSSCWIINYPPLTQSGVAFTCFYTHFGISERRRLKFSEGFLLKILFLMVYAKRPDFNVLSEVYFFSYFCFVWFWFHKEVL